MLLGPRQAGKTFLIKLLYHLLLHTAYYSIIITFFNFTRNKTLPIVTTRVLPIFMYYKGKPTITPHMALLSAYTRWGVDMLPMSAVRSDFIQVFVDHTSRKLFPILFVDGFAVCIIYFIMICNNQIP